MTLKNDYHPYEHFQNQGVKYTTMGGNLESALTKGVGTLSGKKIDEIDKTNNVLSKYIDTLNKTTDQNSENLFEQAKDLRNNQQTLLNQSSALEVKSNYYDTKEKQNAFSIEKNKYRENIFRLLLGLNIILLIVILFIINKA
jgi:hypothetical protein